MIIPPHKDLEQIQLMGKIPDTIPIQWSRRLGKSVYLGTIIKYERVGRMEVMWI